MYNLISIENKSTCEPEIKPFYEVKNQKCLVFTQKKFQEFIQFHISSGV